MLADDGVYGNPLLIVLIFQCDRKQGHQPPTGSEGRMGVV